MKLKLDNTTSITHIRRFEVIKKELKRLEKEAIKTKKIYDNFVSELDSGYNFDKISISERVFELNTILLKIEDLEDQIQMLELFLCETELQLMN